MATRGKPSRGNASRGHQESAAELLLAEPDRLEPGMVGLDTNLKLDEHVLVDVLLRDSLGYPVVALFCDGDVAQQLGRMADVSEALARGRYLLGRLYHNKGLDPSLRPRFVLLAPRYPDSAPRVLDMMGQVEVQAVEYRVVTSSVGRPVLDLSTFHRTSGVTLAPSLPTRPARVSPTPAPGPGPTPSTSKAPPSSRMVGGQAEGDATTGERSTPRRPGATPAARDEVAPASRAAAAPAKSTEEDGLQLLDEDAASPEIARALFLRARDSIRSLSSHVVEDRENDRTVFKVEGKLLAALQMESDGLHIQIGAGKPAIKAAKTPVANEEAFNERLNAIFSLYFETLGPDRMSS